MRRDKKWRKRLKRERLENKRLVKKYPWLKPYNVWTGKPLDSYHYEFTWADDMPRGWMKAFGTLMFDEINEVLKRTHTTIYTEQVKEKFGELRWYCSAHHDIQDIINDYTVLSRNICVFCGRPDVPMVDTGWMCPECKQCFEHNQKVNKYAPSGKYEDYVTSKYEMSSERKWSQADPESGDWKNMSKDISDKAEKIRARYRKCAKC